MNTGWRDSDVHLHLVSTPRTWKVVAGLGGFQVHLMFLRRVLLLMNCTHMKLVISVEGTCLGLPADVTKVAKTFPILDSIPSALTPMRKKSYEVDGVKFVTINEVAVV